MLVGLIYDASGQLYTPAHTFNNGKRYRYYVARRRVSPHAQFAQRARIPADDLETVVTQRLLRLFSVAVH